MSRTDHHLRGSVYPYDREVKGIRKESERRARQAVRAQLGRVPRTYTWDDAVAGVDDVDVPATRHRHEAQYNAW